VLLFLLFAVFVELSGLFAGLESFRSVVADLELLKSVAGCEDVKLY